MRKKKNHPISATSLPEFRISFLRVLEKDYHDDPLIARILLHRADQEHCAVLFWLGESDARDRIAQQTERRRDFMIGTHDDAVRGLKAAEFLYLKLYNKPHLAEYLNSLRNELQGKRQEPAFEPPKTYGRDRDWAFVRYAQTELEFRHRVSISSVTLADLLNASAIASGRKPTGTAEKKKAEFYEVDAENVEVNLRRLNERTFARLLPFYQRLLAQHYPRASDFPAA